MLCDTPMSDCQPIFQHFQLPFVFFKSSANRCQPLLNLLVVGQSWQTSLCLTNSLTLYRHRFVLLVRLLPSHRSKNYCVQTSWSHNGLDNPCKIGYFCIFIVQLFWWISEESWAWKGQIVSYNSLRVLNIECDCSSVSHIPLCSHTLLFIICIYLLS